MRALRIDLDGTVTEMVLPDTGAARERAIQDAVGGWFEVHQVPGPMCVWLNEDGMNMGLQPNLAASLALSHLGANLGRVLGPAVFTGGPTSGGDVRGLAPSVSGKLERFLVSLTTDET